MKDIFDGIYHNKNVLVTGHTGFKGSWLSQWLQQMGANIIGYSLPPESTPSHFELLEADFKSINGDLRDREKLRQVIDNEKPEIIFHLAAQSLVLKSYESPLGTFETNIMGTANLLDVCRTAGQVKAIIIVTSDKCYENKEWVWAYRESDPLGGYDPYSASKGCAEIIASSYRRSFFPIDQYGKSHTTLIATARAGNVIGGGDWAEDRLIPDIVRATVAKKKVPIRNPKATRPWQHVLESLSGYLLLGQRLLEGKKEYAESWNFGSREDGNLNVETIIKSLQQYWNEIDYDLCTQEDFHEATFLHLDCSKARTKLKWEPVMHIDEALEMTGKWYRSYYEDREVSTAKQLLQYVKNAKTKNAIWAGQCI